MTDLFFNWDEIEWIKVDANIRRKQIWLDKLMHVLVEIKAGGKAPKHNHPHEQTGYLLQGTLKVFMGDEVKIISAGEGYLVPPNVYHGVEVIGETDALIFDTFTPQREDFK
jgi:quercetin dioxygenase-like cupin family protein